LRSGR